QVQDNKQISTPHLLQFQLGDASLSVRPANRHHGKRIAAYNGFQRHLHSEIKMGGDERLYSCNHLLPIEFEGIGEIIEGHAKECFDEQFRQAIQDQFVEGVAPPLASTYEPGAKDTSRSFQQLTVTLPHAVRPL